MSEDSYAMQTLREAVPSVSDGSVVSAAILEAILELNDRLTRIETLIKNAALIDNA